MAKVSTTTATPDACDSRTGTRTPLRRQHPGESLSSRSVPTTAHHRTKIEAGKLLALSRRVQVAEMVIRGFSRNKIAVSLGVSITTIRDDLAQIKKDWRELEVQHFEDRVNDQLRKIDEVEREAWLAWERSKSPRETYTAERSADGKQTSYIVKEESQIGDPQYLTIIDKCIGRRCSLLGLNAPKKTEVAASVEANVNVSGTIGMPRRDQMRDEVLKRITARPELMKLLEPSTN